MIDNSIYLTPTPRLTSTARTITKSRLRRHKDALLILQHMSGAYGVSNVSDLTHYHLCETVEKFNVPFPSDAECAAYDAARANGLTVAQAMAEADRVAGLSHLFVANVSDQPAAVRDAVGTSADVEDKPDSEAEAEAPAAAETSTQPGELTDEQVNEKVRAVMALMGAGDFTGYQTQLRQLVREAAKPPVVQIIERTAVDPSKIRGTVPNCLGPRTAEQAGLGALAGVLAKSTALNAYDAPDAPRVDDHYRWHPMAGAILSIMRRGKPAFFYGPAGTGKTEFAQQVAARWGRPFVRISCDDQTDAQTLMGMTVPDGQGGVKWQDGQLTAAIRRPGTIILVDEPSAARPGALLVLQAVLDGDRRLHIAETGEVVPVAPDVVILLADNTNGTGDPSGQYAGTRILNRATLDRPDGFFLFDYLDPATETRVISAKTGISRRAASMLCKLAALTRAHVAEGKLAHGIGMRRLLALASLLADGVEPEAAYQVAVIEGAPWDDREGLRQAWVAEIKAAELAAAVGSTADA